MTDETNDSSLRDQRVNRIIAAYLEARRSGQAPSQEQLLAQNPDLAAELASFFADKDQFDRLAEPLAPASPPGPDEEVPGGAKDTAIADAPTIAPGTRPAPVAGDTVRYFGDYELLEEIARGGMGVVFKARQVSLNRIVALKMILAGHLASPADVQRFHSEAEAAAQLDHPGIVPIYEVGEHEGQQYFSMKFVEGPSLADRLATGPVPSSEAAVVVRACAHAAHYAHERGVIHRDLKPANILLQAKRKKTESEPSILGGGSTDAGQQAIEDSLADYDPIISDFGLAKQVGRGQGQTASGAVLGTPGYMPPEQASGAGEKIGPAADIYSLGAVLYALLTGRPPFQAATMIDTLLQVIEQDPTPPSQLNPKTARDLETICLKCLEKRPERRYESARLLADDLERFLSYEPIQARPINRLRRAGVWLKRRPWTVTAVAVLGVFAVLGLAYGLRAEIRHRDWEIAFLQAHMARLAIKAPPENGPQKTGLDDPAAERALGFLRRAARIRPDTRLYEEALDVWLAQGKCGRRIFPGNVPVQGFPDTFRVHSGYQSWLQSSSRDGRWLLYAGYLIDLESGKSGGLSIPNGATAILDPSGAYVAANVNTGTVAIYDRATSKKRAVIDRGPNTIEQWQFLPTRDRLAIVVKASEAGRSGFTRQIEICKALTGKSQTSFAAPGENTIPWAFSGDGRFLAWSGSRRGGIQVHDTETGTEMSRLPIASDFGVGALALDEDGTHLAWSISGWRGGEPSSVSVVTVATGAVFQQLWYQLPTFIDGLSYTPGGSWLLGQSSGGLGEGPRLRIWESTTGKPVTWLASQGFAQGSGPRGEIVIVRRQRGKEDDSYLIDQVRPGQILTELEHAGLTTSMEAPEPESWVWIWYRRSLFAIAWPFAITFVSFIVFQVAAGVRRKRGLPIQPLLGLLTAFAADLGALFSLRHILALIDLPEWPPTLAIDAILSVVTLIPAVHLTWDALRHYRSAAYGEKLPVRWEWKPSEETKRFLAVGDKAFRWIIAFLILSAAIAYLDGAAKIGLLGFGFILLNQVILCAITAGGVAVAAFLVHRLVAHWKKTDPHAGRSSGDLPLEAKQPSPRLLWKTVGWLLTLLAAISFVGVEVGMRIEAGLWPRIQQPGSVGDCMVVIGPDTATFAIAVLVLVASAHALWRTLAARRTVRVE